MKVYTLTKHEDAAIEQYQKDILERYEATSLNADDPGDFEGLVSLLWPLTYVSFEDAMRAAQLVVNDDFAQPVNRAVAIVWTPSPQAPFSPDVMTGTATMPGLSGSMTLAFRVREHDVEPVGDEVYVVSLTDPPSEREAALDQGEVYASVEAAKAAVYAVLGITPEEANWDDDLETHVAARSGHEAPTTEDRIIQAQRPFRFEESASA